MSEAATITGPDGTTVETYLAVRFRCPHCRKSFASKSYALNHARECWRDPAVQACYTCTHYRPGYGGSYDEGPGYEPYCEIGQPEVVVTRCAVWVHKAPLTDG